MQNLNSKKNHDFLVLMDFSEASYKALKYSISMAKMIPSHIHVLYVANGEEVVDTENGIIALRAIEEETRKINKTLKSIVEIINVEGLSSTAHYQFGNVKHVLKSQIDQIQPELVILGKKKKVFS